MRNKSGPSIDPRRTPDNLAGIVSGPVALLGSRDGRTSRSPVGEREREGERGGGRGGERDIYISLIVLIKEYCQWNQCKSGVAG